MNILIVGNGSREHALAWKISQSKLVKNIYVAPGNAGTELDRNLINVDINLTDISNLVNFAKDKSIDLTIVGPELPLVMGIVDIFRREQLNIFGPTKIASEIEGSKVFMKDFLVRHNIPTAKYQKFDCIYSALKYIRRETAPFVIKMDSLASGKGTIVANDIKTAEKALFFLFKKDRRIIIEEFIDGEELSFTAMVYNKSIIPMVITQDHKRIGDMDHGPNTGGMGSYSPVSIVTDSMYNDILHQIVIPIINGVIIEKVSYTGFIYIGLIIDKYRQVKVIEINCRLGDPEAQSIVVRLKSDLLESILDLCNGTLKLLQWDPRYSLSVILATKGYPDKYKIGDEVHGIPVNERSDIKIFYAGTKLSNNRVITNGGRVLCITALDNSIKIAKDKVYKIISRIHWNGIYYRKDIGYREIKRRE